MITVNDRPLAWEEGMTVSSLLKTCNYTYPSIVVSINGKVIHREAYSEVRIHDGDQVKVIHMVAGG